MKSVVAATTLFLAASAFVIPGFAQQRSTSVETVIASKHQARNKPVSLPRNKAPPKSGKKSKSSSAQKKPAAKDDTVTDDENAVSDDKKTADNADEEDMATGENDAHMEEKTIQGDARVGHTRRTEKPAPKKAAAKPKGSSNKSPSKMNSTHSVHVNANKPGMGDKKAVEDDEDMSKGDVESVEDDENATEDDVKTDEHKHVRRSGKPASKQGPPKSAPKQSTPNQLESDANQEVGDMEGDSTVNRSHEEKKAHKKRTSHSKAKLAAKKRSAKAKNAAKKPETQTEKPTTVDTLEGEPKTMLRARDATAPPTDVQILQYALTLEHLENAFYHGALEKFGKTAFTHGGLPAFARMRYEQIANHEASHVAFLTSALGDQAPAPCEYNFPYTDPKSFAALSMILEGVGVSAYLGAAQFIQDKEYLTAAGSILTTESRHAAWISSAVNKGSPWSGPYDTPLSLDEVYSLAAGFITSCPSTNPVLPVKAFPQLVVKTENYQAGDTITLDFDASAANGEPTFLAIFSGLNTTYAPITNNEATLPHDLYGTAYGVITTNGTAVNDDNTIAGVAIFGLYDY